MLKFETLKCLKPLHYYYKLYIALLLNLKGDFLAPEVEKTQKMTKNFKKL